MDTLSNTYPLFNRDGAKMKFERVKDNEYRIVVDRKHKYCLTYVRVVIKDDINYEAFDPAGGPYIHIGYKVNDNVVVDKIYKKDNTLKFILKWIGTK